MPRPQFNKQDYLNFVAKLQKLEKQLDTIHIRRRRLEIEETDLIKKINKFKSLVNSCKEQFR